jgi:hypothetical protein
MKLCLQCGVEIGNCIVSTMARLIARWSCPYLHLIHDSLSETIEGMSESGSQTSKLVM